MNVLRNRDRLMADSTGVMRMARPEPGCSGTVSAAGRAANRSRAASRSPATARPVVALDNQRPRGVLEPSASGRIAQELDDGVREGGRRIGQPDMLAVTDRQPFSADGGRHDRLAHGHRFENLQARAAANAKRHDVDGAASRMNGPHIVDAPGHVDSGVGGQGS